MNTPRKPSPAKRPKSSAPAEAMAAPGEGVRLNVFLQSHGVASRRKADELIAAGLVKVDGKTVRTLGTRVGSDAHVTVDGKPLKTTVPKMTLLLNKPDLCLTTRADSRGRTTIFNLPALRGLPSNVQAVGRLDYRSEGLLLLTNDGDLAYALTHPKFSVEKTYTVLVANDVTVEDVETLRAGVMLDDGLAKALSVRLGNRERLGGSRGHWLEIVVAEGRNRLIRRMLEALGMKVIRLVRTAVGALKLPMRLNAGQAAAVRGDDLRYVESIRDEMLAHRDDRADLSKTGLTPNDLRKRKIKRGLKLNDEEYAEEQRRRSAQTGARQRERLKATAGEGHPLRAAKPAPRRRPDGDGPDGRDKRDGRDGRSTRSAGHDHGEAPLSRAAREQGKDHVRRAPREPQGQDQAKASRPPRSVRGTRVGPRERVSRDAHKTGSPQGERPQGERDRTAGEAVHDARPDRLRGPARDRTQDERAPGRASAPRSERPSKSSRAKKDSE